MQVKPDARQAIIMRVLMHQNAGASVRAFLILYKNTQVYRVNIPSDFLVLSWPRSSCASRRRFGKSDSVHEPLAWAGMDSGAEGEAMRRPTVRVEAGQARFAAESQFAAASITRTASPTLRFRPLTSASWGSGRQAYHYSEVVILLKIRFRCAAFYVTVSGEAWRAWPSTITPRRGQRQKA
jgi:hypothetical protein